LGCVNGYRDNKTPVVNSYFNFSIARNI